jgi:hypothetical protein
VSEPAYQTQTSAAARQPTAPLRDWLATLSRIESGDQVKPATAPSPAPAAQAPAARRAEPQAAWEPRIVHQAEAPAAPSAKPAPQEPAGDSLTEDDDIAALMAENLMLKARLRLEADRYDELQAILAEDLRALRSHVQDEMDKSEQLRAERDLWMARAEALAQPLFQRR